MTEQRKKAIEIANKINFQKMIEKARRNIELNKKKK